MLDLRGQRLGVGRVRTSLEADLDPLRVTREVLRALLLVRDAVAGVNAVLARGGERPVLHAGGTHERRVDAAPEWQVPWTCASGLVALLGAPTV